MAGLEDLAAYLAVGQQQKAAIAESDPYAQFGQIGNQLLGQVVQDQNASLREKIAGAAITGLLGGGFTGLSDNYQLRASDAYRQVLMGERRGESIERPSVLSRSLFSDAKDQASLFKLQAQLMDVQALKDVAKAEDMSAAGELGKLKAYGGTGAASILNPINKEIRGAEKESRDALRNSPMIQNFQDIKTNFHTLKDVYAFNDRPATLAFVSSFARILDPQSVVRSGELKNAENTQSFMDSIGYKLSSLMSGEQSLSPETKQMMVRAAGAKYNRFGEDFNSFLTDQQGVAERAGGSKENVFSPAKYEPFEFITWAKGAKQTTIAEDLAEGNAPSAAGGAPDMATQLSAAATLRDQLKAGSGAMTDTQKLAIRQQFGLPVPTPTTISTGRAPLG